MRKIGEWVSWVTIRTIQWGIRIFRSFVYSAKNPVAASIIAFVLFFSVLYVVDSDNDVVEIIGVIANLMIAVAVFRIQYISYNRETEERRYEKAKKVLMYFLKELKNIENSDTDGNVLTGSGSKDIYIDYIPEGTRYLVYWKFEYLASLEKYYLEIAVRRLYFQTGKHFFGSTILISIEQTIQGSVIELHRNDSNPSISGEKGRKSVGFGDFGNKEWELFMRFMQGTLYEHFKDKNRNS